MKSGPKVGRHQADALEKDARSSVIKIRTTGCKKNRFDRQPIVVRPRRFGLASSKNSRTFTPSAFPMCQSVTIVGLRWPNSNPLT
jgi:hypothetical protein